MTGDEELRAVFTAEVGEQLARLDERLARPATEWDLALVFRLVHNIKGAARMTGADVLAEAAHAVEDLVGAIRSGLAVDGRVVELVRDGARLLRASFDAIGSKTAPPDVSALRAAVEVSTRDFVARPPEHGAHEAAPGIDEAPVIEAPAPSAETIRVAVEKIDSLVAIVSELAAALHSGDEVRASAAALVDGLERLGRDARPDPALRELAARARAIVRALGHDGARRHRIARTVQQSAHELRMVRVDALRGHLGRVVRAASRDEDRAVELEMAGGATEIDRAILDGLRDPLVHLVRNAVAHGIESRDEREAIGKPPAGRVVVEAAAVGAWVEIVVRDDGRGIDVERVRTIAIERGLVEPGAAGQLSRQDALDLVFLPGLSTRSAISELAGRGIGMDVVRSNLEALGGSVALRSEPGLGTEARLRAPLTRLTMRVLCVLVAGRTFALPFSAIERTLSITREEIRLVDGIEALVLEARIVPVGSLAAALELPERPRERRAAVVLAERERRVALWVDAVLGDRDLTIQPLPWNVAAGARGVSATAVLENGEVVFVLDPQTLVGARHAARTHTGEPAEIDRKRRVLVVDDSITSRTLEKNILTSAGYEVVVAVHGAAALEVLAQQSVDLVVSDIEMPELDGIAMTRRIRATPGLERLPIILVTSLGDEADKRRGADAGADAYVVKGLFDQDELLRAVARLL